MTAYCFVGSPGFSNSTCIFGALPLGAACSGATYSPPACTEEPLIVTIPTKDNVKANCFAKIIDYLDNRLDHATKQPPDRRPVAGAGYSCSATTSQLTPLTPGSRLNRLTICSSSKSSRPVLVRTACTSTLFVCSTSSLFRDLSSSGFPPREWSRRARM